MTGLYYEEFEVGETIDHERRRTVSESDDQHFRDVTTNRQSLRLDAEAAGDTQFGEHLVNGLYTVSLAVGLTISDTTDGTIVANLSYDDVEHPAPTFHGDTIGAHSAVTDERETGGGERGVVTMHVGDYRVADGEETVVREFDRTVLSLKRPDAET